jgi:transposase
MRRCNPKPPKSPLGQAIDYTLTLGDRLNLYLDDGHLEIDNNLIERYGRFRGQILTSASGEEAANCLAGEERRQNGIRPTAIGKKNYLFIGGETTSQRAAILYTMAGCARRHGHSPEAWLADVLARLPAMTNQDDLAALLPANWQPATAAKAEEASAATPA